MPDCKFCGNSCEWKEYEGQELAICSTCFPEWKKLAE